MDNRLVEHLQRLSSRIKPRLREPEHYLFQGDVQMIDVRRKSIVLPSEIVRKVWAFNYDSGCRVSKLLDVFMTYDLTREGIYWCYPYARLEIDETKKLSEDQHWKLINLCPLTLEGKIIPRDERLILPKKLRGAKKVFVRPDREVFILEKAE